MQEVIGSCFTHIKIGYFLFFLIFPFIYIGSLIFSKKGNLYYRTFLLVSSLLYYFLLEINHLEAFLVLVLLALMNVVVLQKIYISKKFNLTFFDYPLAKVFLIIGIILNLIPLIFIKDYIKILGIDTKTLVFLNIIGLSYFVFNSISLLVDFYKERFKYFTPLDVFIYLFYFPKVLAGPLVRFKEFVQELYTNYSSKSYMDLNYGLFLISFGVVKKWIADFVYSTTSPVLSTPEAFSGDRLFLSIYMYSIFIFLDFSGYTDIARGTSLLLGIKLPENFNTPYLSKNLKEFWRRWHITLYQWIKDYIYIDLLGGNRKGKFRTYLNILVAFTLSGIWHGNYFNYVIWGFLHGIGVILSSFIGELKNKVQAIFSWFVTFNAVSFLWMFFAIIELDKLSVFFSNLFKDFNIFGIFEYLYFKPEVFLALFIGFSISFLDTKIKAQFSKLENEKVLLAFNSIFFFLILILLNFKKNVSPFLYESF